MVNTLRSPLAHRRTGRRSFSLARTARSVRAAGAPLAEDRGRRAAAAASSSGDRVALRQSLGPLKMSWRLEHRDYIEGRQFRDCQLSGPFRSWTHTHTIEPDGPDALLSASIGSSMQLPAGAVGPAGGRPVRPPRSCERLFAYRHAVTAADLASPSPLFGSQQHANRHRGCVGIDRLGLVAVSDHRRPSGPQAGPRTEPANAERSKSSWDPAAGQDRCRRAWPAATRWSIWPARGSPTHRWTAAQKEKIRASRVESTTLLARTLAGLNPRPRVLICASAIGFYGDRGEERLDEASRAGRRLSARGLPAVGSRHRTGGRCRHSRRADCVSASCSVRPAVRWPRC